MRSKEMKSRWSGRGPMWAGVLSVVTLVGFLGVWGTQAKLSGAIIAPGNIEVQLERQVVEHQEGGVVSEILARDGDKVAAGDVVLRLDTTFLKSEIAAVEGQYFEVLARRARLEAEQDSSSTLTRPASPANATMPQDQIDAIFDGQTRLFAARLDSLLFDQEQLGERVSQLENQIDGVENEKNAVATQRTLLQEDVADTELLLQQGLSETRTIRDLKRQLADTQGRFGRLEALIAQHRGEIAALRSQQTGLASQRREDAISELRDVNFRGGELAEKRLSLLERLARLDIRAPMSGRVFGSTVVALQSVAKSGSPLMYIVPDESPLVLRARVNPVDVDKIAAGQPAALRFAALDMRHTPEIAGTIRRISADSIQDKNSGMFYYEAEIVPDAEGLLLLNGQELVPGMPAEALIRTRDRTFANYMIKPLADYFTAALREE